MAIIPSSDLFNGDRLDSCLEVAQLHWVRLYLASNNYARLELNYRKIVAKSYVSLRNKPTEEQFWAWIQEYHANFLRFVYEFAADRRSPAPPPQEKEAYCRDFIAAKARNFSKISEIFRSCAGLSQTTRAGIGVGTGTKKELLSGKHSPTPLFCRLFPLPWILRLHDQET